MYSLDNVPSCYIFNINIINYVQLYKRKLKNIDRGIITRTTQRYTSLCEGAWCAAVPLAESFLVLMIFAAYSCPDDFFTHLRTTEKAPLRRKNINNQISI